MSKSYKRTPDDSLNRKKAKSLGIYLDEFEESEARRVNRIKEGERRLRSRRRDKRRLDSE